MRVLIFTSSHYSRPYMLRSCVMSATRQSHKDFVHSVNVTVDEHQPASQVTFNTEVLLWPFISERLVVTIHPNEKGEVTNHFNNMSAIQAVPGWQEFDVYMKMDDDDIYLEEYVKTVVDFFKENPKVDITSSAITLMLNGNNVAVCNNQNLGANPNGSHYKMPMTFAFNKKALDVILPLTKEDICGYDDMMWRVAWEKAGLVHKPVDNSKNILWHIHGKNISTSHLLK